MEDVGLHIAATILKDNLPKDLSLIDRISFSMKHAIENESDIFFMYGKATDDMKIKAALAAVILEATDVEKELITNSIKPLKMLSAAIEGIPVDFGAIDVPEDIIPILDLWHKAKNLTTTKETTST